VSLPARVIEPEILDLASSADAAANLADIVRINRWFGGYRVIRQSFACMNPPERFSVLDVGAASGDNGRAIREAFPGACVTSLDHQLRNLTLADASRVVGDAFALPFAPASFDYVFCSLFLHHFEDSAVVELLRAFARTARRGVVATDLERHAVAAGFLPATRILFGWRAITLHDGPISVRAAFKAGELRELARRAGLAGAEVRRHLPWFRISLTAAIR